MQEFLVRAAHKNDVSAMMLLIKELALFEKAPHEVTVTLQEFSECGFGENPIFTSYVAECQGKIIGLALYYIRYSTWKGKRIYLEDLIVNEKYRGKGVGKKLFHQCLKDTVHLGYHGMVWQVLDWNTPAIEFYDSYGSKQDAGWLNCALEREEIEQILNQ